MKKNRRTFLKTAAVAGTAITMTAKAYSQVPGANGNARIAYIGVGGRCQQHIDVLLKMQELKKSVVGVGACDVWDGDANKGGKLPSGAYKGQGLHPSAKRMGVTDASHIVKDYRRLLEQKDVDIVCISTPDHWHAKQTIDAMEAGKHVYCEKPMVRTISEAQAVVDSWKKTGKVMSVGVQSMADPTWLKANEMIRKGKIGHVMQAQTRYYRNSNVGQWRYYTLTKTMNPTTVDWDMFLGHKFELNGTPIGPKPEEVPFDRAVFAQWRCYWPFGGGMYTDLFVHQVTHILAAMGVRYPRRVVGGGGIYLEYDTREVPDVATVVADFDEGCQLLVTATMCNDYPIDECIRGKTGTFRFVPEAGDLMRGFEYLEQKIGAARGPGDAAGLKGELIEGGFQSTTSYDGKKDPNPALTYALWENFLTHVTANNQGTLSTPELGAAAFTTVNMGVLSYRNDKALYWDKEARKPVDADGSWSKNWEARSKARGKPNQIQGWEAGDTGSTLNFDADAAAKEAKAYMKLAGPWVNGKDPAGE
jgi:predicted dehydrogenase